MCKQLFEAINELSGDMFLKRVDYYGKLFEVDFVGEEGVDAGGLYRFALPV